MTMEPDFWRSRWHEGRIGFHEGRPNTFLVRHHDWLAGCRRVLVPLCGKAEDLAYLASLGHEVIGIELVEDAVRQFFAEHDVTPEVATRDGMTVYTAGALTIIAGDYFATTAALVGAIDGIYDRAALIALPPELRPRYIAHLRTLAPAARHELLITLEDPAGGPEGPPFSVPEREVREHFASDRVTRVDEAPATRGRAGVDMIERCYTVELA
jgi:thiopurine S-methyltransferase